MSPHRFCRRELLKVGFGMAGGLAVLPSSSHAQSRGLDQIGITGTGGEDGLTMIELINSLGFLKKYNLEPNFVSLTDGTKVTAALVSGYEDLCRASGFGQTLAAISRGLPLKVVGGACVLIPQAIYTKRADIKSLKDLEGRTVGAGAPGALIYSMTTTLLRQHGVDLSKVTFVNVGTNADVFRAVAAGTIDAGSGSVDVYGEQAKYGVHSVADYWTDLPDYPYQACYTSMKQIEARRDVIVRALAGFNDLYNWVQSDGSKEAYVRHSMKAIGATSPARSTALWTFFNKYKPYSIVLPSEKVNYLQRLNVETGVQKAILPLDQVIDASIAQDALKLSGKPG